MNMTKRALAEAQRVPQGPNPWHWYSNHAFKTILNEKQTIRWNNEWLSYSEAQQTKFWIQRFTPSNRLHDCSDATATRIIQFVTGHGPFLYHWVKSHPEHEDTDCRLCLEEEETPRHLATNCPALTVEQRLLDDLFEDKRLSQQIDDENHQRGSYRTPHTHNVHHTCLELQLDCLESFVLASQSLSEVFRQPDG